VQHCDDLPSDLMAFEVVPVVEGKDTTQALSGIRLLKCICRLLCRFSDAGSDDLTTRYGGRRPKSAKARNRGKFQCYRAAGHGEPRAMGIWARSLSWAMAAAALDLAWKQCRAEL
jgi:hypothetical protein